VSETEALFWDCAVRLYEIDDVHEGTIFGFRCLALVARTVELRPVS
jgi:hypothetical protein